MREWKNEYTDKLMKTITEIKTVEEAYQIFEDLCTVKEITDFSQRLEVARLLDDKKSYQQIHDELGVSTTIISRVSRCMVYGTGGYKKAVDLLDENK